MQWNWIKLSRGSAREIKKSWSRTSRKEIQEYAKEGWRRLQEVLRGDRLNSKRIRRRDRLA